MFANSHVSDPTKIADAKAYGGHMAMMLLASHFTLEQKQAWAEMVPHMSVDELKRFDEILRADMLAKSAHDMEDLALQIKASMHKRDLALAALNTKTTRALDEIAARIDG